MDPSFITTLDWSQIGALLKFLWGYLVFIVALAGSLLLAHAVLPSLRNSGHLSAEMLQLTRKARPLLYLLGLLALALAAVFMASVVAKADVLEQLYARWWI